MTGQQKLGETLNPKPHSGGAVEWPAAGRLKLMGFRVCAFVPDM